MSKRGERRAAEAASNGAGKTVGGYRARELAFGRDALEADGGERCSVTSGFCGANQV